MDRRQFLKRCFQIGGYAAIAQLGMGAVEDAIGHGILPALIGGSGGNTWPTWGEEDESKIASSNIVALSMENTSAGGNETGQGGGLSEADRTLTQVGGLAGATGSPLMRQFDSGYWMTLTNTLAQFICSTTYTIIMKWNTVSDLWGTFFRITEGAGDTILSIQHLNKILSVTTDASGTDSVATAFTNTGNVYIVFQTDGGVHNGMLAWSVTKPTSFSAIPAGQKVDIGTSGDISGETAGGGGTQLLATDQAVWNANSQVTGKLQYLILSNTALLTY